MGTNGSKTAKRECLSRDVTDKSKAKEEATIERVEQDTALRLHALQQTFNHLEDSLRVMSTYKSQHGHLFADTLQSPKSDCPPCDITDDSKASERLGQGTPNHRLPSPVNNVKDVHWTSTNKSQDSRVPAKSRTVQTPVERDPLKCEDTEAAMERLELSTFLGRHALQQTVSHLEDSIRIMSKYKSHHCLLLAEIENLKTSIKLHLDCLPHDVTESGKAFHTINALGSLSVVPSQNTIDSERVLSDVTDASKVNGDAAIDRLQQDLQDHVQTVSNPRDSIRMVTSPVDHSCPSKRENLKFSIQKEYLDGDNANVHMKCETAIARLEQGAALRLHALQQTVHHLEDSLQIMSVCAMQHRFLLATAAQNENSNFCTKKEDAITSAIDSTFNHLEPATSLRLLSLQQTVSHLEDSLQVMSAYKTQHSLLLAKNEHLKTTIENKTVQFQSALNRLSAENEELRTRLHALESTGSEREEALWRRLRAAEEENTRLTAERDKCEKCLDQVAHGVVQALLSQKGLGEEITTLREKVKELEKQNYALSSLLLHNVPKGRPSIHTLDAVIRPLSCDDGRLRWSQKDESLLWTPAHRPSSLNLDAQPSLLATLNGECHKDEGYSTMSSEVQGEGAPSQSQGPLERLQEESGRLGEDVADDLKLPRAPRRSSSDSALLPLSRSPSRAHVPLALLTCEDSTDWWEPALCEPEDDAVPPPPELEEWNMDDIPGLSFLDLEEEDVWSAVDSWSSGRTTASSSLGASHVANGGFHSKRSSGAESAATGISAITPGDGDGVGTTSFTSDFYRLVKFESNKSLASTSSKSQSEYGGKEPVIQNVPHFTSQQACAEEPKDVDIEPSAYLEKTVCIQTNFDTCGISSDEQAAVKPSESWGLLTVPEEPEAEGEKRRESEQLEDSPLRAANTLAELEKIVSANEEEDEDFERKEKEAEEKPNVREWRPTGWVHLHRAEFNDPKARANYADLVMLASRSSSSCSGSSESGDDHSAYQQLHRLHRSRRHKKASATRDGAVRIHLTPRVSIVGREDIFTRFGAKEAEAVASFDFLEELEA